MLYNIDNDKLNKLLKENVDAKEIFTQMIDNHKYIVSKISHELRNPLTLINSSLQLIEMQHPEVKNFNHWSQTIDDLAFTKGLLNELTSFNNSETLQITVFPIENFFKHLSISFAISLETSKVEFTSFIEPTVTELKGDKNKLQEIFLNLFRNAHDAVGPDGHIQLRVYQEVENCLIIEFSDDGCGISEDHIDHIFNAFQTYKPTGTGLGLSITKRIVEAHQGTIEVSSTLGVGSTFTIRLPVQKSRTEKSRY